MASGSAEDRPVRSGSAQDVALKEMDEVNPQFATTDVALVVGANDVVNRPPRARRVRRSTACRSSRSATMLLFGDAKDSLTKVVTGVKNL